MCIISTDISPLISNLCDLPTLVNLVCVNSYFSRIVSAIPIYAQHIIVQTDYEKSINYNQNMRTNQNLIDSCKRGFIEYVMYLENKYKYTISLYNGFGICCEYGHIDLAKKILSIVESEGHYYCKTIINNLVFNNVCKTGAFECAKWIFELSETGKYGRIDVGDKHMFSNCCADGHIEIAKWLVQLSESGRYNRINIDTDAFALSCANGYLDMAKWLIMLGETPGYNKININSNNDSAFRWACQNGRIDIAKWLIALGETDDYGKVNINVHIAPPFYIYRAERKKLDKWLRGLRKNNQLTTKNDQ